MNTSDRELMELWRDGDPHAGTALFDRQFSVLERFFKNKVPNDVDDLIQETFLACVARRDTSFGESSFRTYLLAIAHDALRRHCQELDPKFDVATTCLDDLTPHDVDEVEGEPLLEALRRVPFRYQVMLELALFEEMSPRDIGVVVAAPAPTVQLRLRRGREHVEAEVRRLACNPTQVISALRVLEGWAFDADDDFVN